MKKLIVTLVAVALVVISALFVIPAFEGETIQTQVFSRVGMADGGE